MVTVGEIILLVCTIAVVLTGALMALLIGYVVPTYYLEIEATEYHLTNWSDLSFDPVVSRRLVVLDGIKFKENIASAIYLVSLSRIMYTDEDRSLEFCCTGTAVADNLVMTGIDCIAPELIEADFKDMIVRSESNTFSDGGHTHKVLNYTKCDIKRFEEVYMLEVYPKFSTEVTRNLPKITDPKPKENDRLSLLGWGGDLIPRDDILYYGKIYQQFWRLNDKITSCRSYMEELNRDFGGIKKIHEKCAEVGNLGVKDSQPDKGYANGRPLVRREKGNTYIVGMQCNAVVYVFDKTAPEKYFLDLCENDFKKWLGKFVNNSEWSSHDTDPRRLFHRENCSIYYLNHHRYYSTPGYGVHPVTNIFFPGRTTDVPYVFIDYFKTLNGSKRLDASPKKP